MSEQPTSRRALAFRALTLIGLVLLAVAYFSPAWWVALKAPNYPEATFPQGIRILFHMDSVRNGCAIRTSKEVEETEALDCTHEMDTINHYVGMYPIASGGPVEKAFSPFLFAMMGVMLVVFMIPGRVPRMAVSLLGYGAVGAWMAMTMYGTGGIAYQGTGYLQGLVNGIGQDTAAEVDDENLAPIVKQLKESLAKSGVGVAGTAPKAAPDASRPQLVDILRQNYVIDNDKKPASEQSAWTGSGLQVMAWHYDKSLGRWFNDPAKNNRLAAIMTKAGHVLFWAVLAAMAFFVYAARSTRSIFYYVLVLVPALVSVGFLTEYSAWLWWYGHSMNEMGAFTLKPFMPTVFGQGKVAQFTTYSYPHYGFGLMVAATLVLALAALIRRKQIQEAGEAAERV
jgi:hypothetical protein